MTFYFYENWRARGRRAVIHDAECAYCNGGRGLRGEYDRANAVWDGPYDTLDDAREFQRKLGVEERTEQAWVHG